MKRIVIILLLSFFVVSQHTLAQATMSDEQVISFVQRENERGTSRQQIVTKLMQRGVSIEQIRRIEKKYKDQAKDNRETLGRKEKGGLERESRLRKNHKAETKEIKGEGQLKPEKIDPTKLSQEERELYDARIQDGFYEGLETILPDTTQQQKKEDKKIKVFGRDLFNNKQLSFEPNMNIATPSDYRLGAGDVVYIDIWGASQKSIEGTVSPDGFVDIEGYGPIQLDGLSVKEANAKLRATVGRKFSSSNIRLSVGQTKTIQVNIAGEVKVPGTYTISAFATVFNALYMAGGISDLGTLRNIKVYRQGKLISTVDVYDYILEGKLAGNVRMAAGDMIIVGAYDCLVNITGKVKRPMYYEMKNNESVATLLRFAGGFAGDAYDKTIRLIRKKGGEHTIYTLSEFERSAFLVNDGDSLSVDSTLKRYKNMVEVKGAVMRPGRFQLGGDVSTVRELINAADGLSEDALQTRGIIHRRKADRQLEVIAVDLKGIIQQELPDIALRNEDVLFIPSLKELREEQILSITGEVLHPGTYQYAENTTIEDLVLQAGGLKDAASVVKVDVARRIRNPKALQSANQVAQTFSMALKDGFVVEGQPGFVLLPFDEVYVRKSPGYTEQQHVSVEGEVAFAGTYTLERNSQRLSELVKAAGGLTQQAYAKGARLERKLTEAEKIKQRSLIKLLNSSDSLDAKKLELSDVRYVGINLDKAIQYPGSNEWDLVLQEDDKLVVPQYSSIVSISGEVMYPNSVLYNPKAKLSDYINAAGGYGQQAKKSRVFVVHMNGTVTRARKASDIKPGCEIVVPAKPKRRGMALAEILGIGTTVASLAAVVATMLRK